MADGKQISVKSSLKTGLNNLRVVLGSLLVSLIISVAKSVYNWPQEASFLGRGLTPSSALTSAISGILLLSIPTTIGLSFLAFGIIDYLGRRAMRPKYLKGSKKITLTDLAESIENSKEYDFQPTRDDIKINLVDPSNSENKKKIVPVRFPIGVGAGHTLYVGVSGAGKSQVIESELDAIRELGNKCLIVDPGGRYYEKFGRPNDVILSLYDKRSMFADFWSEEASPDEIATSIIEDRDNHSGSSEFFQLSPRAVFSGLMDACEDMDEVWHHLKAMEVVKLKKLLQEVESIGANMLQAKETAGNVMASLAVKMNWVKHINHWAKKSGADPFLISKWVRDDSDDRWVFLNARERDWSFASHINRVWFDLASRSSFGRGFTSGVTKSTFVICDEISTIGKLSTLPLILDKGRKDGYHLKAGLQDVAQFYSTYGIHDGNNIINGFQNSFIFRANGEDLLEKMEKRCGEGTWLRRVEQIDSRGEKSISVAETKVHPFVADDFLNLKNLNFIIKLATMDPALAKIEHKSRPSINNPDMSEIPRSIKPKSVSDDPVKSSKKQVSKTVKKDQTLEPDIPDHNDGDIPIWE